MTSVTIDADGYPLERDLEALKAWDGHVENIPQVLDMVADAINRTGYGRARRRGNVWRFATGGWSGCEDLIASIPGIVEACCWRSSHRGGLHIYGWGR